ncbi:PadR family transcriptional regulator [Metabacillus sp. SLBN-84]
MEEQLRKLSKSSGNQNFDKLTFTEKHRAGVWKRISKQEKSPSCLLKDVLQLLIHEKTGYELSVLLRARGNSVFDENEGAIYTFLHELEKKEWIQASWHGNQSKFYVITSRGKKILKREERKAAGTEISLSELLEG